MSTTIQKLKDQIKLKEDELNDLNAALRVLLRLEGMDDDLSKVSIAEQKDTPFTESGEIDFDKLELPERSSATKITTMDLTRDVVGKFGARQFSVNHVYAALLQLGKVEESKHVKNRISMSLKKLADEGFLSLAHKGSGNDPHRYRVVATMSSEDIAKIKSNLKESGMISLWDNQNEKAQ